jgi:uncharacterized membrane protein YfcA
VSYPALLAAGVPPLAANMTNTTALFSNTAGAALGARAELRGQGPRVIKLSVFAASGGALGALLLSTPAERFERLVPFLIAFAGVTLLARGWLQRLVSERAVRPRPRWFTPAAVIAVGLYGGYFGAAGVLMLAVLSAPAVEPLAVSNAVKNLVTGARTPRPRSATPSLRPSTGPTPRSWTASSVARASNAGAGTTMQEPCVEQPRLPITMPKQW